MECRTYTTCVVERVKLSGDECWFAASEVAEELEVAYAGVVQGERHGHKEASADGSPQPGEFQA